jgi:hypothetical protein
MPLDLRDFSRLRPYLYHLTAEENIARIRTTAVLESAAALAQRAGQNAVLISKRNLHVPIWIDGVEVLLRDQAPLHRGNIRLEGGWTFEDFVRHLNEHVFFWPGRADGPIPYGIRHYGRYAEEPPQILRMLFQDLQLANPIVQLRFSRSNSGSPRWSRGIPAPRGPNTFTLASSATFGPSQVVEVTAMEALVLPVNTEVGPRPNGPWRPLF